MTGLAQTGLPVVLPLILMFAVLVGLDALVRRRRWRAEAHARWLAHIAELEDETDRHLNGDGL